MYFGAVNSLKLIQVPFLNMFFVINTWLMRKKSGIVYEICVDIPEKQNSI